MKQIIAVALLAFGLTACQNPAGKEMPAAQASVNPTNTTALPPVSASNYWYQGLAEVSTYTVSQARYGEQREAEQVNVFVTEDFSAKKQVKLDDALAAGADRVPVLKLNALRRFTTGIYDYSVMFSVFSPNQTPNAPALKATVSIQDWCGHVFTQLNQKGNQGYQLRQYSYFESEGDTDATIKPDLLEDEIWTALRIDPARFNQATLQVMPSVLYFRFQHKPFKTEKANLSIEKGDKESVLHLRYTDIPRQLDIRFETAAPHRILGWEEKDGNQATSKGSLKKTIMSAYWSKHDNASVGLRDSLDLHFFQ